MDPEEVDQKQQYLRQQILESGYDPEHFIQFLHNHTNSEQTPNIQEFSMKQIKKIVAAYKQFCRENNNSKEQSDEYSNKSMNIDAHLENQKASKNDHVEEKKVRIQYEKHAPLYDYEMKGYLPCIESNTLAKQELKIAITDMETKEIQGYLFGIGSKTEYYYHIQSNLLKGTVKRLSEDFDWLNNTLARLYPFIALPELEPIRKDIKDPYQQRMKDIEQYLQYLGKKSFLLSSHLFVDFITISNQKIEKFKKSYDSMGFAKGVTLLKYPKGFVEIQLTKQSREFQNDCKQSCRKTTKIHETLSQALEKMVQSYRVAIQETYTVVDLFAQLYDTYNEVSKKFPNAQKQEYGQALVSLNNLFVGIGDSLKSSTDIIEKYSKDYFRFTMGYDKNMIKVAKSVKQAENQYLDFKYNLYRKKERVISDPSKWEIDQNKTNINNLSKNQLLAIILPKQTLAENQLKNWYAFGLKNLQNQYVEYLELCTYRYYRNFKNLTKQLLVSDKNYLETLTKFIGECRRAE